MKISYNPLFRTLVQKHMTKGDLCKAVPLSKGTVTKLGKGDPVKLDVIVRICESLHVMIQDVVEIVD